MNKTKLLSALLAAALIAPFSLQSANAAKHLANKKAVKAEDSATEGTIRLVRSIPIETSIQCPRAEDTLKVWTEAFKNAKSTIDMSFFYYIMERDQPGHDLQKLILKMAKKGVKIRMIADKSFYDKMPDFVGELKDTKNIEIRIIDFGALTTGVMHAKYFIVDGQTSFVGSQNFDWRALSQIHEIGVIMKNKKIAEALTAVFELDWNMALTGKKETLTKAPKYVKQNLLYNNAKVTVDLAASPKQLLPSNLDWDFEKLLSMIKNAKETIDMQVLSYSLKKYNEAGKWTELQDALLAAAKRGVKINLLFSSWTKAEFIDPLGHQENITIRISTVRNASTGPIEFARVEHCKYLIADGKLTWISTSNWSYDYFYNSRNLSVIAESDIFARDMKNIFNLSWNADHTAPFVPKEKPKAQQKKKVINYSMF